MIIMIFEIIIILIKLYFQINILLLNHNVEIMIMNIAKL